MAPAEIFSTYSTISMQKALLKIALIATSVFIISGCSSHYGAAKILSQPPGAEVINLDDGTVIGVTPLTTWWKDSSGNRQYVALRVRKPGFEEKVSHFWLSMRHKSQSSAKENPQLVEITLTEK
ncbi:hypothetical protein NBRC116583_17370 [Arenicella sp. 4NH20-0111]|uniref:hypothetical protein n=1 Tax=Arenicella sp. 4NH20-0111 TaxID=3127648 RepID=UPI00310A1979